MQDDAPFHERAFEALGTHWRLAVWDTIPASDFERLTDVCIDRVRAFDALYSRFIPDSLVMRLSDMTGEVDVPHDLISMLRLYEKVYAATDGKVNPAIGFALSDSGYDAQYSLTPQSSIRDVPALPDALEILDDTHVRLKQPVLLDLGALGKGYLIDILYDILRESGVSRFLVDGSGDIRYQAEGGETITCGLEHPLDQTMAIGTLAMSGGALCASATNRRRWGERHHYIDPHTLGSPEDILATWVWAQTAALADGLSSALFFAEPEQLSAFQFEYLIVNRDLHAKSSAGFTAELFV